jgi:hypothetical protein
MSESLNQLRSLYVLKVYGAFNLIGKTDKNSTTFNLK